MGYRRIRDELDGHKGIHVNDKRVLRICRKYDIKSNIKWKPKSCTRGDRNPDHIAKNYLHREFHAEKPNEKWLTDCLLYTSPSPRDRQKSRMPSSA